MPLKFKLSSAKPHECSIHSSRSQGGTAGCAQLRVYRGIILSAKSAPSSLSNSFLQPDCKNSPAHKLGYSDCSSAIHIPFSPPPAPARDCVRTLAKLTPFLHIFQVPTKRKQQFTEHPSWRHHRFCISKPRPENKQAAGILATQTESAQPRASRSSVPALTQRFLLIHDVSPLPGHQAQLARESDRTRMQEVTWPRQLHHIRCAVKDTKLEPCRPLVCLACQHLVL